MRRELIERLAKRIAPRDPSSVTEALLEAPDLQGDLGWLQAALDASEQLRMPPVPGSLSDSLHSIMADRTVPPAKPVPIRVERAIRIHDSRSGGVLVGVRGEYSGTGWTAMYTAASADVILDGDNRPDRRIEVSGQILIRSGEAQPFEISVIGDTTDTTSSDEFGQFSLGNLVAGIYEFSARCEGFEVHWTEAIRP
jgi:hypothetical protein